MQRQTDRPPIKVGILGATGTVGQRFITLLSVHPWFTIHVLGASSRSAGKPYSSAVNWKQITPMPSVVKDMTVEECVAGGICRVCYQSAFRAAELAVFSNAKNFRRDPHVPLIVPLVNPGHLSIIGQQQALHSPPLKKGFIVTNANCSTTAHVIPLAALENKFGPIEALMVTTMQAIFCLDIIDNVVPYISGEEEKIEWETRKILGGISDVDPEQLVEGSALQEFEMHAHTPLKISASCNRVPVTVGHMMNVSIQFSRRPPPSPQQVCEALLAYRPEAQLQGCPSAPLQTITVHEEPDRPQPRMDRAFQDGAGVSVGRVRQCPVLDIKFVVLADNVSIGAATSSIINAEFADIEG
ncbi:aspartate-semialdehyde dehydrogenase, partial [Mycena galericulata]